MSYNVADLLTIMQRLRDPEYGCPWDIEQTFESILPSTIEEVYELADAIAEADMPQIQQELGDVLFQVIFYSQLGKEASAFDFEHVVDTLCEKLLRRHPHVFPDARLDTGFCLDRPSNEELKDSWQAIKAAERQEKSQTSVLDDIPKALPALKQAQKIQQRVAKSGFDFSNAEEALDGLIGEIEELKQAIASKDDAHIAEEMGDVLFSSVNVARLLGLDAEYTLVQANQKFSQRISNIEAALTAQQKSFAEASFEQKQQLWDELK